MNLYLLFQPLLKLKLMLLHLLQELMLPALMSCRMLKLIIPWLQP